MQENAARQLAALLEQRLKGYKLEVTRRQVSISPLSGRIEERPPVDASEIASAIADKRKLKVKIHTTNRGVHSFTFIK